ncbi:MAG TPA: DinB family protein, partial [Gemmataceae bacterium]|nr:DinB family protein [Gemmataceae bacterium]
MANSEIAFLLHLLDQGYDRKAWHGPNLRGSVRGMDHRVAAWRPKPGRHNIWEIIVHAAYWKYAVRRRLLGLKRGSFRLKGSNWFPRPIEASAESWEADLELLAETHQALRTAVAGLAESDLPCKSRGSRFSNLDLIAGIA